MAEQTKTVRLNVKREENDLTSAVTEFTKNYGESFAILYSPAECLLLKAASDGTFQNHNGEAAPKNVFEARIFNKKAELRWFSDNGKGISVTLSETETAESFGGDVLLANPQEYLLWGEISPTDPANENWTQLAEARIGSFYVPIKTASRACFTAIEYLKSYDDRDGNVAVFEERLTGISEVEK